MGAGQGHDSVEEEDGAKIIRVGGQHGILLQQVIELPDTGVDPEATPGQRKNQQGKYNGGGNDGVSRQAVHI